MKAGTKIFLVIVVLLAVVIISNYFIEPVESDDATLEFAKELAQLEKEKDYLMQEIQFFKDSLFETKKFIFDSHLASEYLLSSPSTEILYKEIEEDKYVILFKDEQGNHLIVSSKEPSLDVLLTIPTMNPEEGITSDYLGDSNYHYLGGIITDSKIKKVNVFLNGEVHEADIFQVDDHSYGWYSVFENKTEAVDKEDKLRIEARDENGVIIRRSAV